MAETDEDRVVAAVARELAGLRGYLEGCGLKPAMVEEAMRRVTTCFAYMRTFIQVSSMEIDEKYDE